MLSWSRDGGRGPDKLNGNSTVAGTEQARPISCCVLCGSLTYDIEFAAAYERNSAERLPTSGGKNLDVGLDNYRFDCLGYLYSALHYILTRNNTKSGMPTSTP